MEQICEISNLNRAYRKVKANKGAAGVDRITVDEVRDYFRQNQEAIISSLLAGSYKPNLVLGVRLAKPGGGYRQLGIPTTLDRIIEQAILQVLEPIYDPDFSESSYGFRPGRSAHQALKQAEKYVAEGYDYVVDLDLAQFFDRVNHDLLMSYLAQDIEDKRLLRIIRRYLEAGMLQNGGKVARIEGVPQGGPLSPLLSNIILDRLDKELECRGHKFCRYADDCNIYVRSQVAGERVMASVKQFIEKRLHLKVNEAKSAVARVWERKFLGYSFRYDGRLKVAEVSLAKFKDRIRELTKRNRGRKLEQVIKETNIYLNGWISYFRHAANMSMFKELDSWIRRKLRCYRLRQCKRGKGMITYLMSLGASKQQAGRHSYSSKSWWRLSQTPVVNFVMSNKWFEELKLVNLERKVLGFNH